MSDSLEVVIGCYEKLLINPEHIPGKREFLRTREQGYFLRNTDEYLFRLQSGFHLHQTPPTALITHIIQLKKPRVRFYQGKEEIINLEDLSYIKYQATDFIQQQTILSSLLANRNLKKK